VIAVKTPPFGKRPGAAFSFAIPVKSGSARSPPRSSRQTGSHTPTSVLRLQALTPQLAAEINATASKCRLPENQWRRDRRSAEGSLPRKGGLGALRPDRTVGRKQGRQPHRGTARPWTGARSRQGFAGAGGPPVISAASNLTVRPAELAPRQLTAPIQLQPAAPGALGGDEPLARPTVAGKRRWPPALGAPIGRPDPATASLAHHPGGRPALRDGRRPRSKTLLAVCLGRALRGRQSAGAAALGADRFNLQGEGSPACAWRVRQARAFPGGRPGRWLLDRHRPFPGWSAGSAGRVTALEGGHRCAGGLPSTGLLLIGSVGNGFHPALSAGIAWGRTGVAATRPGGGLPACPGDRGPAALRGRPRIVAGDLGAPGRARPFKSQAVQRGVPESAGVRLTGGSSCQTLQLVCKPITFSGSAKQGGRGSQPSILPSLLEHKRPSKLLAQGPRPLVGWGWDRPTSQDGWPPNTHRRRLQRGKKSPPAFRAGVGSMPAQRPHRRQAVLTQSALRGTRRQGPGSKKPTGHPQSLSRVRGGRIHQILPLQAQGRKLKGFGFWGPWGQDPENWGSRRPTGQEGRWNSKNQKRGAANPANWHEFPARSSGRAVAGAGRQPTLKGCHTQHRRPC